MKSLNSEMNFGDVKMKNVKLKLKVCWKRLIKFVEQLRRDCKLIDDAQQAITIIELQTLHQWRYMHDEVYRIDFYEFIEEIGLSMSMLEENNLMLIPIGENGNALFKDQGISPNSEEGST